MKNQPKIQVPDINPATGLPLVEETYIDVGGNPYGADMHTWQPSYDPEPSYAPSPSFDSDTW